MDASQLYFHYTKPKPRAKAGVGGQGTLSMSNPQFIYNSCPTQNSIACLSILLSTTKMTIFSWECPCLIAIVKWLVSSKKPNLLPKRTLSILCSLALNLYALLCVGMMFRKWQLVGNLRKKRRKWSLLWLGSIQVKSGHLIWLRAW